MLDINDTDMLLASMFIQLNGGYFNIILLKLQIENSLVIL